MKVTSLRAVGLAVSCSVVLAAAGCSVDLGQVFSSPGGDASSGGQGGQGGSGAQGGSGGSGASGGATTTTTTGQGGSTTTTSTTTTSTTTTTTTTSTTTTTTTGQVPQTMDCGDNTACDRGGAEICCWNDFGVNGPAETGECQASDSVDCNNELSNEGLHSIISCQNSAQCDSGKVCCGHRVFFNQTAYYETVDCQSTCDYPDLVLCTGEGDDADCPIVNVQGQQVQTFCKVSNRLPPGYFICSTQ